MNYDSLHTSTLEKLFGSIKLEIVKQDDTIRIIKLIDSEGISRTLGIVRFLNIQGNSLKKAHTKILAGALLGKTLYDSDIKFNKELVGTVYVKLPNWLKEDFKTENTNGFVFYSKISVDNNTNSNSNFLYSELIEIIPLELKDKFSDRIKSLRGIDENLHYLLDAAELEIIKVENDYD